MGLVSMHVEKINVPVADFYCFFTLLPEHEAFIPRFLDKQMYYLKWHHLGKTRAANYCCFRCIFTILKVNFELKTSFTFFEDLTWAKHLLINDWKKQVYSTDT